MSERPTQMFAFAPLSAWARMLWDNPRIERERWPVLASALVPSLLTTPLRVVERLWWAPKIARTEIRHAPLFVLGYARCGTTHLHNLLGHDPALGYITTFQALAPALAMVGERTLKPLLARALPATRPTDNVAVDLDAPQEEEIAVANLSWSSMLHFLSFPQRHDEYFRRRGLMQGMSARERAAFTRAYLHVLRTATLRTGGKRLVLKCPLNMGRLPALLELFPDARFVHIVRNPYDVYPSLLHLLSTMIADHRLQPMDRAALERCVLDHYRTTFEVFDRDRALIPDGRYTEVRYETLEADPLGELARVYRELHLPGWSAARPAIADYAAGLHGYRKNRYALDEPTRRRIAEAWGAQFRAWSYPLRPQSA